MNATPREPLFENASRTVVSQFVYAALAPIARILIRYGWSVRDFADVARWVFVKVFYSTPEFWRFGRPTALQGAIKTGLPRQHVKKLNDVPEPQQALFTQRQNLAYRVIEGWVSDPEFQHDGKPAPLPLRHGRGPTFNRLVLKYGNDVTVGAVLADLCDVGCTRCEDGVVTLVNRTYGINFLNEDRLAITGYMLRRHGETVDQNLSHENLDERRLHRMWFQTRIPVELMEEARAFAEQELIRIARCVDQALGSKFAHAKRKDGVQYGELGFIVCLYESDSPEEEDHEKNALAERSGLNMKSQKERWK